MSHQAVKTIQTSVPPVSQPVDRGMPVDQLGMNLMPNAPVIFRLGSVVDDTKLTAGEIAVISPGATLRKNGPFSGSMILKS
jgi:hypothetical protein